jgi:hypothetical protein
MCAAVSFCRIFRKTASCAGPGGELFSLLAQLFDIVEQAFC